MKHVAKAIVINDDGNYLLLKRSGHPVLANDPDVPGGIVEADETPVEGLLREVLEETGVTLNSKEVRHIYSDTAAHYSTNYTYHLYRAQLKRQPEVTISWEHASYDWVSPEEFLKQAHTAADSYMRMVYDTLRKAASHPDPASAKHL